MIRTETAMTAEKRFKTKLEDGFIALPFDVRQEFGRARPPVTVSINRVENVG